MQRTRNIGQHQLVVTADKQLPAIEVLQLLDVLRDGAGGDISSSAARTKLPSRALASKALSALSGGSLRDTADMRRGGRKLFYTSRPFIAIFLYNFWC